MCKQLVIIFLSLTCLGLYLSTPKFAFASDLTVGFYNPTTEQAITTTSINQQVKIVATINSPGLCSQTSINIWYSKDGGQSTEILNPNPDDKGQPVFIDYSFQNSGNYNIEAFCDTGSPNAPGGSSGSAVLTVQNNQPITSAPQNPVIGVVSDETVNLSWSSVPDALTYRVTWSPPDSTGGTSSFTIGGQSFILIDNLSPSINYSFSIAGCDANKINCGPNASISARTLDPPEPPTSTPTPTPAPTATPTLTPAKPVDTVLGSVPTDPVQLIQKLIAFATGIGGGVALLLMISGAFQMITSAGNAEAVKKGQEQFSSAVIGLLFIIFSVILLQIIGVNILSIPGFK